MESETNIDGDSTDESKVTRSGKKISFVPDSSQNSSTKEKTKTGKCLKKDTLVWLVGHPKPEITGAHLPTKRDVYLHFHHVKNEAGNENKALKEYKEGLEKEGKPPFVGLFLDMVAQKVLDEALKNWRKCAYFIEEEWKCRLKILKIHQDWKVLKKSKNKTTPGYTTPREDFQKALDRDLQLPARMEFYSSYF